MKESIEHTPSNIERLREMEQTGNYLFHGSPESSIEILEPRQSTHTEASGEIIEDGDPAVSATPYLDLAVFRGIVNEKNIRFPHTSGFGLSRNSKSHKFLFDISNKQTLVEAYNNKAGFVYVFNKSDFQPYSRNNIPDDKSMEWRSYKSVKPLEVIKVHSTDLIPPHQVNIINPEI